MDFSSQHGKGLAKQVFKHLLKISIHLYVLKVIIEGNYFKFAHFK